MKILDCLPFSKDKSEVWTPDGLVEVKPYQIVVMVSLATRRALALDPGAPRIPAILDTGHNHTFIIRRDQLNRWTGLRAPERGRITIGGHRIPLMSANVWIHPNQPKTSKLPKRPPFRLELKEGIAVIPDNVPTPARLPILGLRALVKNELKLIIDGKQRTLTLKTPGWL